MSSDSHSNVIATAAFDSLGDEKPPKKNDMFLDRVSETVDALEQTTRFKTMLASVSYVVAFENLRYPSGIPITSIIPNR
ncbi:hypothetical protein N7478_007661 [Penicillium angulare]|uniref:uncharacterized protein n=1 Tax=Penicillium angulare TaxID=116970 RepID=UPI0025419447|nr:uncharacterized protein N7478_007661 [Penicillium angulare]KAJ5272536.1 hypothetical protein N7478_007661 [Penicillium angulare]